MAEDADVSTETVVFILCLLLSAKHNCVCGKLCVILVAILYLSGASHSFCRTCTYIKHNKIYLYMPIVAISYF